MGSGLFELMQLGYSSYSLTYYPNFKKIGPHFLYPYLLHAKTIDRIEQAYHLVQVI